MEVQVHLPGLLHQLLERRRRAVAVEQHGVALELGYRHAERIGVDQGFQQFLDDVLAVLDLGLGDELREAAEIRNEEQDFASRRLGACRNFKPRFSQARTLFPHRCVVNRPSGG
jgi:hypothetical protein